MRTAGMPLRFLIVAVAVAAAAAVTAAGAHQEASAQDEMGIVTVGVLVPYDWGEYGTYVRNAIDLSVYDFNRGAYERGWMLETVEADTGGDGETALRAVESMYADGIRVVIGPAYSSTLEHISDYVNRDGIVTVSYASGSTALSVPDDYIFRTTSDANTIADAFVAQMRDDGITRVVTISVDDAIGRSVEAAVGGAVGNEPGMDMVGSLRMPLKSADPDYAAAVASLGGVLAGIPDADRARTAVVLFDHSGGIVDVARGAATLDGAGDTMWYGPDHSMAELETDPVAVEFMKTVGYRAVELAANESHVNVCIDAGLGARVSVASMLAYHAYDAVSIVGAAIDAAGGPDYDAAAVRNGMTEASRGLGASESAIGVSAAFNENGDLAASDYLIYEIDDASGRFAPTARYDSASDSVVPNPAYEPRRIGALVSETGSLTVLGYPASKSICLAVADYNSQLRANGADWQLHLTKLDDGTIPSRTLDNIRELYYDDGIQAVLGPVSSASLSAVMDSFEGLDDTVVISYASSSPILSVEGDNVFRIRAPDTHAAPAYAKLLEHDGIESVVVIHREDAWGHALSDAVEGQLAQNQGIDMIASFQYDPAGASTEDLRAVSDRVGATVAAVDGTKTAILLFGFEEISVLLGHASANPSLQDSKWYGYSRAVIGTDPERVDWEERVRFLSLNPAYVPNDVSRSIYDRVPGANVYTLYAYDATFTLANAVGAVGGSTDAARLVQAVPDAALSVPNPAVGFPLALDPAGDLDARQYTAVVYKDGSFVDYAYYDGSEDRLRLLYQLSICR
ncbi:MAG: ABC transporter substrate-binding protein [Thaumarchaeota archaeon]|nr:ABC transporter substrate-binding protein [Nitrososphaerota archaeon]